MDDNNKDEFFNPEYSKRERGEGKGEDEAILRLKDGDQAEIVFAGGRFEAIETVWCGRTVMYDPDLHGTDDDIRKTSRFLINVAWRPNGTKAWVPKMLEMSWTVKNQYIQALDTGANGKYTFTYKRVGSGRSDTAYFFNPNLTRQLSPKDLEEIRGLDYHNKLEVASLMFEPGDNDKPPERREKPDALDRMSEQDVPI